MPAEILIEYLNRSNAIYSTRVHAGAYTAPEIAELAHIHGLSFAKGAVDERSARIAPAHLKV